MRNILGEVKVYTEGHASLHVQEQNGGKPVYRMKYSGMVNPPNVRIVEVDGELECYISFPCTSYLDSEWSEVVKATDSLLTLWYQYTRGELNAN